MATLSTLSPALPGGPELGLGVQLLVDAATERRERGRSGISSLVHNGTVVEESRYLTDRFTDDAIAFIDQHKAEPFFVYLPLSEANRAVQARAAL